MGGFNRGGKQAELARKMALAKQQKSDGDDKLTVPVDESHQEKDETTILSAQELQLKQDHQLFAQLLKNSNLEKLTREKSARNDRTTTANPVSFTRTSFGSTNSNNTNNNSYGKAPRVAKNKKKKKATKKEDKEEDYQALVLQEGDIARRPDFETLVSCASAKPLGNIEAAKLVPWVPPFLADYMVVLVDPRTQSGDLRKTLMYLSSTLEPRILEQLICINADSVAETTSWMNRAQMLDMPIKIFSDQKWEWMKTYSAVVEEGRWSMSIIVICNSGRIRKILREVDPSKASQVVMDAVQSIIGDD